MLRIFPLVAVAALLCVAAASAQSDRRDEIVVHGQRVDDAMRAFVGEIAVPQTRERQIARWDRKICMRLVGLGGEQGQYLVDQVARRAFTLGLTPSGPSCDPNVLIFVTRDSDVFTRQLVARYPAAFTAGNVPNMSTLGEAALQDFVTAPRPVRWWHVAQTVTDDGQIVRNSQPYYRATANGVELAGLVITQSRNPGRIARSTRQDFQRAIIVVDANRTQSVPLATLADYLAMTTLAQIDMGADVGDESILSLFSSASHPSTLTTWDEAYLDGLYHATRNARNFRQQEGQITSRMHRTLDH